MNNKFTAIIYSLDEAKRFIKYKPNAHQILPITPDARAFLLGKINCEIINPLDYFNDFSHKRAISRLSTIEKYLIPSLEEKNKLSKASIETFRGLFHLIACAIFYIHYNIRSLGPWLIFNGESWEECYSLDRAEKIIINQVLSFKDSVFNFNLKNESFFQRFSFLINKIQIKRLKSKRVFLFSGFDYGLPGIKDIVLSEKNNIILNILSPGIKSQLKTLLNIFHNNNEIFITTIPSLNKSSNYIVKEILSKINDPILTNLLEIIERIILNAIVYTNSIEEYIKIIFNEVKIKAYISHQLRWLDGAVFGEIAMGKKIQTILISHGSHPSHKDFFSSFEHKENARGLLFSPFATKTFIQSPKTISFSNDVMSKVEKIKSKPLMWGNNYKEESLGSKQRIILHAGTFKELGMRPWIYETSNEYIYGLQLLVEAISELKNTHLIIKVRPSKECSLMGIKKLIPKTDNCEIISHGSFLNYLAKARLLVSFSSTTIEEALYARKPVGLFGGTNRYRHLEGSSTLPSIKSRSAIYHLNKDNLTNMLDTILDVHKYPLIDKELNNYIWDSTVSGKSSFLKHIKN